MQSSEIRQVCWVAAKPKAAKSVALTICSSQRQLGCAPWQPQACIYIREQSGQGWWGQGCSGGWLEHQHVATEKCKSGSLPQPTPGAPLLVQLAATCCQALCIHHRSTGGALNGGTNSREASTELVLHASPEAFDPLCHHPPAEPSPSSWLPAPVATAPVGTIGVQWGHLM